MQNKFRLNLTYVCSLALLFCPSVMAGQWYIQLNNDLIFNDDGDFTNTMVVGWESSPGKEISDAPWPGNWQGRMMFAPNDAERVWGLELKQRMWTPAVISIPGPQVDERPYAGLLEIESHSAIYGEKLAQKNWLSFGVTGPASGARLIQEFIHKITTSPDPLGWDFQVEQQLTLQLAYEVDVLLLRKPASNARQWELSAHSYSMLGNFRSESNLGLTLRWGKELANSFGGLSSHHGQYGKFLTSMTSPGSLTLYGRAQIGYRVNDLTIEGDLPYESDIRVQHRQAQLSAGILWAQPRWSAAWSLHFYSKEYDSDPKQWHGYGSLTIGWMF